jgi:hypothetical protein
MPYPAHINMIFRLYRRRASRDPAASKLPLSSRKSFPLLADRSLAASVLTPRVGVHSLRSPILKGGHQVKFDGVVTDVKTNKGYGNPDRLKIDIDLNEGIGKERAFCGLYLPKDHPACMEYLAAWQMGRRLVVSVELA